MASFWSELKRRKVVRVGMGYAVIAWLLLQIVVSIEEPLGLPDWTDTLVIVLLAVGFCVALVLAWAFDLTPQGIERTPGTASSAGPGPRGMGYALTAVVGGTLGAGALWLLSGGGNEAWLHDVALPEIEGYLAVGDWQSAYSVAVQAEERLPDSEDLTELWPRLSWHTSIRSDPPGATVYRRPYLGAPDAWERLGETPLEEIRLPYGLTHLRLELEGYRTLHRTVGGGHVNGGELGERGPRGGMTGVVGVETFHLDTDATLPPDKVRVPGWEPVVDGERIGLNDYFLDRYEVTNEEFKRFVEAGGYELPSLWDPIVADGETIPWEAAMRRFVDTTGRPGPGNWEAGDYPAGEGDHPVSGVSWYEAAAYARWVGEELPTAHHWRRALALATLPWQLPESNFGGDGTRAVSESRAMSYAGAFDLAGNVREWTATPAGSEYIVLGGSWSDPYYVVGVENASAPPLDRSAGNGFRLVITDDEPALAQRLLSYEPRESVAPRDVGHAPVEDAVFAAYGRLFDYDQGPLDSSIEEVVESRSWVREKVTFAAGYGGERMALYLYVPAAASPPFQTVIYWPGWDTFRLSSVDEYFAKQADFLVKSGRAVAFPMYQGTFERGDGSGRPPFNTTAYRDNTIEGVKDLRRTIDYLETRREIDTRSIAFYGYSWGGVNGSVALAHEPRLRTAIIYVGLIPRLDATPEIDPVSALPRVRVPLLMFSGEFDAMVPLENARQYFGLVGSPAGRKRHVVAPAGHFVPRSMLIRETLDWLDRYQVRPGA